jgi:hypothetical protein
LPSSSPPRSREQCQCQGKKPVIARLLALQSLFYPFALLLANSVKNKVRISIRELTPRYKKKHDKNDKNSIEISI